MFSQDFRTYLRRTLTAVEEWQDDASRTPLVCRRGHRAVAEIHQNAGVILTCPKCRDYQGEIPSEILAAYRERRSAPLAGQSALEADGVRLPQTDPEGTTKPAGPGSSPPAGDDRIRPNLDAVRKAIEEMRNDSRSNFDAIRSNFDAIRKTIEEMRNTLNSIMVNPLRPLPKSPAEQLRPGHRGILDDLSRDRPLSPVGGYVPRGYDRPQIHDVDPRTMDLKLYGSVDNVVYDPRLNPGPDSDPQ